MKKKKDFTIMTCTSTHVSMESVHYVLQAQTLRRCCRMHVLSNIPTLRELDFVAVSKLDRDTVSVFVKSQPGARKA